MALKSWKGKVIRKQDIFTAKNYLNEDEIDSLNRFGVVFLETAELRAKNRNDLTIKFWKDNVDKIIEFNDKPLLTNTGKISNTQMEKMVSKVYESFDSKRKKIDAEIADNQDLEELKQLEKSIKNKKK